MTLTTLGPLRAAGQAFFRHRDLGDHVLLSLFSSGGADNADLPYDSSYRAVTPMALAMQATDGKLTAQPWPLHYQPFNYAPHNGLYRPQPVLEYRYG